MGSLVHDCPHCGTLKSGFTIRAEFNCGNHLANREEAVCATCNNCLQPVCAVVFLVTSMLPSQFQGDILQAPDYFISRAFYPAKLEKDTPDGVPLAVARAYDQAAASRHAGHWDAACGMYRRAMELGLKAFSPEIDAWKIEKRIDKMAAENKITPELQTWAHELRLDGNDALHGEEEATKEMADQMHGLCRFLLLYLYTLPLQVEAAKTRRAGE